MYAKKGTYYCFILIIFIFGFINIKCKKINHGREIAVTADSIKPISNNIIIFGTIVDLGEKGISDYGFCWSEYPIPDLTSNYVSLGIADETGNFQATIYNIQNNKKYFIRAFINDGENIEYSNELSFIAGFENTINISATQPLLVDDNTLSVACTISNLGSFNLVDFGLCWGINTQPTISSNAIHYGSMNNDSSYNVQVTGLYTENLYCFRAFAKPDITHVYYGNIVSATIPDLKVSTDTFSIINTNDALIKGTILQLGLNPIVNHGFCWSTTTPMPNYNSNRIELGPTSQTGQFLGNIYGLQTGLTYYFRAFATDGNFVKYGMIKQIYFSKH